MRWMIPINDLNGQQKRILESVVSASDETHWVSGFAGTGKTIVLTHAIEKIAHAKPTTSICFLTYTHALKDLVASGLSKTILSRITIETVDTFKSGIEKYNYIFVDEIQDITDDLIERIIARARHIIAAGDPEQSIYLGRVDPNDLKRLLGGAKKHTLRDIERLTLIGFQLANSILPDAAILRGAMVKEEGSKARLMVGRSQKDEFLRVYKEADLVAAKQQPSAVLFPTHRLIDTFASIVSLNAGWGQPPEKEKHGRITSYEKFNLHFKRHKSPLRFLGSNNGSLPESDDEKIIYLMTFHSAKGLDFNNVFLPNLTEETNLDAKWGHFSDEMRQRRHFFVAITRSREHTYFSYHGVPHRFVGELPDECIEKFEPRPAGRLRR